MMKNFYKVLFFFGLLKCTAGIEAQQKWTFELCGMLPYNFSLPLVIRQSGQADINMNAHYRSEPFTSPFCWVWRMEHWSVNRAWELQAIHHKLFLEDKPQEVQSFSITHGFNLITINRAWRVCDYVTRAGLGIVLAHPESMVRGKQLRGDQGIVGMGYYVSGPAFLAGSGKQIYLTSGLFLTLEAMATVSYADVPVKDGDAHLYNVVFQLNFGLGYAID